jgi:DNA adenine methylase
MKTLIPWFGGKARLANRIIKLLPFNDIIYGEPFGGAASVLLNKPRHPVEIYNDRNEGLTALFECLSDKDRFSEFYGKVVLQPYSRAVFERMRDRWQTSTDVVERAVAFYTLVRQSFGGDVRSWGYGKLPEKHGGEKGTVTTLRALDALPEIHERIRGVIIERNDWERVFDAFDTPETLWYCDPPYVPETRSAGQYTYELTQADHERLTKRLLSLKGRALLSGYEHEVYRPLEESGWRRLEWEATAMAAGTTRFNQASDFDRSRTECLWIHPRVPLSGGQVQDVEAKLAVGKADDSLF